MKTFRDYLYENFDEMIYRVGIDREFCDRCKHKEQCLDALDSGEIPASWCIECVKEALDRPIESDEKFFKYIKELGEV